MKKLRILLATALVLPVFTFAPVFAEGTNDDSSTDNTTSTDKPADSGLTAEQLKEKRDARVAEYKTKQKTKLAAAEKKKIQASCKAAQGKVSSLIARTNNVKANRKKVYQELGTKLDKLIEKLKAKGIDTAGLEAAKTEMQTKADALSAEITTFEQMLTDLSELDCATDPEAFKAALEEARDQREVVATSAKDLRTYVTTTLRDLLKELRGQVAKKTEESTSQTEGGQ